MAKSDELRTISETFGDAAEDAKTLEETIEEQRKKRVNFKFYQIKHGCQNNQ